MSTAETREAASDIDALGAIHWLGVLAALVSAGVHLLLGVRLIPSALGISFVLASVGFVGGVVLVLAGIRRRAVYAAGIPFTLVQIVLWYVINFAGTGDAIPGDVGTLGAVDKIAQVVLLVVLMTLVRR